MANSLQIDLIGKVVIFRQTALTVAATEHPFLVTGGFGASPHTNGRTLGGTFLSDGEDTALSGYDVWRLATDEEIEAARKTWPSDKPWPLTEGD